MEANKTPYLTRIIKKTAKTALIAAFWLAVWQFASALISEELFLVPPAKVLCTIIGLSKSVDFWITIWNSLSRILLGFCLALGTGLALSYLSSLKRFIYDALNPVFSIIKATPVASFTILALLWLKSEHMSIFIAFLMAIPVFYYNVYTGISRIDPKLLEMAAVFGLPAARRVRYIYIPGVLPYLLSAASSALGLSWKAGVAAEVISITRNTIGNSIYQAKNYLETAEVFAWTAVIVLLSVCMERLFTCALKRAGREE